MDHHSRFTTVCALVFISRLSFMLSCFVFSIILMFIVSKELLLDLQFIMQNLVRSFIIITVWCLCVIIYDDDDDDDNNKTSPIIHSPSAMCFLGQSTHFDPFCPLPLHMSAAHRKGSTSQSIYPGHCQCLYMALSRWRTTTNKAIIGYWVFNFRLWL